MTALQALLVAAALVAVPAALYGLHRLALWLEARGQLYYLKKRSEGGAAGSFVALQQFLEPESKHVHRVQEQKRHRSEDEGGGAQP
jgi:hypothetical protein